MCFLIGLVWVYARYYMLDGRVLGGWMDAGLHVREAKILILCVFLS